MILTFLFTTLLFGNTTDLKTEELATFIDNNVKISWNYSCSSEIDYFIIEKSKDGKYFKELSFIKNHSTRTGSFIEIDSKPYRNESIYRIKYVLMNGNVYYGKPLIIKENDSDILKWNEKQNIKTLLVVKDKHNNDFHFKSTVSYVNGKIYCLNNPGLAEGKYTIVASDNDALVGYKIYISTNTINNFSEHITSTKHQ